MTTFAYRIRPSVQSELNAARQAMARGQGDVAFRHLERAHVLGQGATVEHVRVHWGMLLWAIRYARPREVVGQIWRLMAAGLTTRFGWLPEGNTGGADVSAFRPMPIPPDLQHVIDAAHGRGSPRRTVA
ncbi:MAG: DUF3703 domain-containing protein [Pseudomonadales bacterium]